MRRISYKENQNFAQSRSRSSVAHLVGEAVANAAHANTTRPPSFENVMVANAKCEAKTAVLSPRWYFAVYHSCSWMFIPAEARGRRPTELVALSTLCPNDGWNSARKEPHGGIDGTGGHTLLCCIPWAVEGLNRILMWLEGGYTYAGRR